MRVLLFFVLLTAGLVSGPAVAEESSDVQALGEQLLDENLDRAYDAAEKLIALGPGAVEAVPELTIALSRQLDARVARLQWHRWRGVLPRYHDLVVRTLGAIGPTARLALPSLKAHLGQAHANRLNAVVQAILAIGGESDETYATLESYLARGSWPFDESVKVRIRELIESRGNEALPLLVNLLTRPGSKEHVWAAELLATRGDAGNDLLLDELSNAPYGRRSLVLRVYAGHGLFPGIALDEAAVRFGSSAFPNEGGETWARAFAASGARAPALLAKALRDQTPEQRGWRDLYAATPDLARRVSALWFASRRPPRDVTGFDDAGLRRTPLCGGTGGTPFEDRLSPRATLVALRVTVGGWGWRTILRMAQPIFDGPDGKAEGTVHGTREGTREVWARKGFALGGIYVQGEQRVEGFAPVWFRWRGDRLDPKDAWVGPWVGGRGTAVPVLLGGQGHRIIGLSGRYGADLDAIGLIEARAAPAADE